MTLGFYDRMGARVTKLLAQYGRPWTLSRTTAPGVITQQTFQAVKADQVRHTFDDGDVAIGDNRMLAEAAANPQSGDRITSGAQTFIVMRTESIQPADAVLAWWLWVRAG